MVEKSCCAPDRFPDCRSWANCWKAWAMGLLFCDVDVVCGASFCNVAKSACAAERFPADKSCPNCWTSCCTCCFWLCGPADSSKSKRLLLEIPETDMKNLLYDLRRHGCAP